MMGCFSLGGWYRLVAAYGNNPKQRENSTKQPLEIGLFKRLCGT
jgi:hypothetical protein